MVGPRKRNEIFQHKIYTQHSQFCHHLHTHLKYRVRAKKKKLRNPLISSTFTDKDFIMQRTFTPHNIVTRDCLVTSPTRKRMAEQALVTSEMEVEAIMADKLVGVVALCT